MLAVVTKGFLRLAFMTRESRPRFSPHEFSNPTTALTCTYALQHTFYLLHSLACVNKDGRYKYQYTGNESWYAERPSWG